MRRSNDSLRGATSNVPYVFSEGQEENLIQRSRSLPEIELYCVPYGRGSKEPTVSYFIARTVSGPFEVVVADVMSQLKKRGFGVLTDIDVQGTLKSKIGVDMTRYRILGACNPDFAFEGLKIEDKLGVLLPCNVIVRETADQRVEVATVDPVAAMERTGNPALRATAEDVRRLLTEAIADVGG
jgi:uncharacterized protein (DUF302 family)